MHDEYVAEAVRTGYSSSIRHYKMCGDEASEDREGPSRITCRSSAAISKKRLYREAGPLLISYSVSESDIEQGGNLPPLQRRTGLEPVSVQPDFPLAHASALRNRRGASSQPP